MTIGSQLKSRLDQRSDEALANRAAMEALWQEVAEQLASVPTISNPSRTACSTASWWLFRLAISRALRPGFVAALA